MSRQWSSQCVDLTLMCSECAGPYFFVSVCLENATSNQIVSGGTLGTALAGTLVSSLHRLKDQQNNDGAFFVFGDLSVKIEGTFRLQFNLYQMRDGECVHIASETSDPFFVHSAKNFPGMAESTALTRCFSDQGVRLRLRKEPRTLLRKRGPGSDDYEPRTYNKNSRAHNSGGERQTVTSPDSQGSINHSQNEQSDGIPAHNIPFEHRPAIARQYTDHSTGLYSGNSYEEANKRPRTGSDQSQASSFGHVTQGIDSPHYNARGYSDSQAGYNTYSSQIPQNSNYNLAGFTSPTQSRDHFSRENQYLVPKINTQLGSMSHYDQSQRSPNSGYFSAQPQGYPSTAQQAHYSTNMTTMSPLIPQRLQHNQNSLDGLGIGRQMSSPMGTQSLQPMNPPMGNRMPIPMTSMTSMPLRRETFPIYSDINQNASTSNIAMYTNRSTAQDPSESPSDGFR